MFLRTRQIELEAMMRVGEIDELNDDGKLNQEDHSSNLNSDHSPHGTKRSLAHISIVRWG